MKKPQIAEECSRKKTIAEANKDRADQDLDDAMKMPPPPPNIKKTASRLSMFMIAPKQGQKLRRIITTVD